MLGKTVQGLQTHVPPYSDAVLKIRNSARLTLIPAEAGDRGHRAFENNRAHGRVQGLRAPARQVRDRQDVRTARFDVTQRRGEYVRQCDGQSEDTTTVP